MKTKAGPARSKSEYENANPRPQSNLFLCKQNPEKWVQSSLEGSPLLYPSSGVGSEQAPPIQACVPSLPAPHLPSGGGHLVQAKCVNFSYVSLKGHTENETPENKDAHDQRHLAEVGDVALHGQAPARPT